MHALELAANHVVVVVVVGAVVVADRMMAGGPVAGLMGWPDGRPATGTLLTLADNDALDAALAVGNVVEFIYALRWAMSV